MILPDVPVALCRRGPLVLLNPRKVNPLRKIANRNDAPGGNCAAVDRCHVQFRFSHDVGGRALASRRDRAKLMADALAFDVTADGSALPIPHIPAVPNADDESVLVSAAHYFSLSLAFASGSSFICDLTALCRRSFLSP